MVFLSFWLRGEGGDGDKKLAVQFLVVDIFVGPRVVVSTDAVNENFVAESHGIEPDNQTDTGRVGEFKVSRERFGLGIFENALRDGEQVVRISFFAHDRGSDGTVPKQHTSDICCGHGQSIQIAIFHVIQHLFSKSFKLFLVYSIIQGMSITDVEKQCLSKMI